MLSDTPEIIGKNKAKQDSQTDEVLEKYGLKKAPKAFIREDGDILGINTRGVDCFVVFPYALQRFSPLIYLAETKKPVIIVSDGDNLLYALETYDYLSDHPNVRLAFCRREVHRIMKGVKKPKLFGGIRVCLFDAGNWVLDEIAWHKNPLFQGMLNVQTINMDKFLEVCEKVNRREAEAIARLWIGESIVNEPTFEDVAKSARIYLAMKGTVDKMKANAAYVLWCGQFMKPLGAKMCFSISKLADDGYPIGCWRGGNLLPLLIIHEASHKPVFTPEALSNRGKTITFRHCFAPSTITDSKCVLRRWRNVKGTVTGYCHLPRGAVTLINCGVDDKIAVVKGRVISCKDIGGKNCRITALVRVEHEDSIRKFMGSEFAMVYGDYVKSIKGMAHKLGIKVL